MGRKYCNGCTLVTYASMSTRNRETRSSEECRSQSSCMEERSCLACAATVHGSAACSCCHGLRCYTAFQGNAYSGSALSHQLQDLQPLAILCDHGLVKRLREAMSIRLAGLAGRTKRVWGVLAIASSTGNS